MELQKINKLTVEEKAEKTRTFVEELKKMPIAIQQDKGLFSLKYIVGLLMSIFTLKSILNTHYSLLYQIYSCNMTANEQHYEVPDEFYYAVLGPYLKYSSGFWKDENTTLAESEIYMLDLYVERAGKIIYSLS